MNSKLLRNCMSFAFIVCLLIQFVALDSVAFTGGPITPEVSSLATVGEVGSSVDKVNGGFTWSLPVMDVQGRGGLDFPISVRYSAGIKMDQEASWVGLGWDLSPGAIYRSISHMPDDYHGSLGRVSTHIVNSGSTLSVGAFGLGYSRSKSGKNSTASEGFSFSTQNLFFNFSWELNWVDYSKEWNVYGFLHYQLQEAKNGWDSQCKTSCYKREYNRPNTDTTAQPPMDVYVVTGPGPAGRILPWRPAYDIGQPNNDNDIAGTVKFFFTNHLGQSDPVSDLNGIPNESAVKVDYSLNNLNLQSFTITDVDGKKYIYGYPVMIYYTTNVGRSSGGDNSSRFSLMSPYAYAWYLTAILDSDYVDSNDNGIPDDSDKGNWIKFEYQNMANGYNFADPYTGYREAPIIDGRDGRPGDNETRNWGKKDIAYLSRITTPTHKAEFLTEARNDGIETDEYDYEGNFIAPKSKSLRKLSSINLYKRFPEETFVGSTEFVHNYFLRPNSPNSLGNYAPTDIPPDATYKPPVIDNAALTLFAILFKGSEGGTTEKYTFNYRGNNPGWDKNKWDQWGYYKSDAGWQDHTYFNRGEYGANDTLWSAYLEQRNEDVAAWSLTDIYYPLGGALHVDYEANTFIWDIDHQAHVGGGLRTKELTLDDGMGNKVYTRYIYENSDLASADSPNYANTSGRFSRELPLPYGKVTSVYINDIYADHPYANREVYYKKIIEIPSYENGNEPMGRIVSDFTTPSDYINLDSSLEPHPYYYPNGWWMTGCGEVEGRDARVCAFYDRQYAWGLPLRKAVYGSDHTIIEETTYSYTEYLKKQAQYFYDMGQIINDSIHAHYQDLYFWGHMDRVNMTQTKDGVTKNTTYTYDPRSNLVTSEDVTDQTSDRVITTTEYCSISGNCDWDGNAVGQVAKARNILNLPRSVTVRKGDVTKVSSYSYNQYQVEDKGASNYSRMRLYQRAGYDWDDSDGNRQIDASDKYTNWTNLTFDDYGNVLTQKDTMGIITTTEYDPDSAGALVKSITTEGRTTQYEYGDRRYNDLTKIINPDGTQNSYGYDEFGRLKTAVSQTGAISTYTYNTPVANLPYARMFYFGNLLSPTVLNWVKTEVSHDSKVKISKKYADGTGRNLMSSNFDGTNWILSPQFFDASGRPEKSFYPFSSASDTYDISAAVSAARYAKTAYYSDPLSRIKEQRLSCANSTCSDIKNTMTYGNSGAATFKTEVTDPNNILTTKYSNVLGAEEKTIRTSQESKETRYPWLGLKKLTDAEGKITRVFSNTLDQKIASVKPDMESFVAKSYTNLLHDENGSLMPSVTEEWEYNDAGKPVLYRDANMAFEDKHLRMEYDSFGRIARKTVVSDDDPSNTAITGTEVMYWYDTYPDGEAPQRNLNGLYEWQERATGKITKMANASQTEIYFYNDAGLMAEKDIINELGTNVFEYDYDQAGELVMETIDPVSGGKAKYAYNNLGQISTVDFVQGGTTSRVAEMTYLPDGKINTLTRTLNGVRTTYGYDDLKRLSIIKNDGTSVNFSRVFRYDNLGRITQIYNSSDVNETDESKLIGDFRSGTAPSGRSLGYDDFGRLLGGKIKSASNPTNQKIVTYTYDKVGNRQTSDEGTGLYTYQYNENWYQKPGNRLYFRSLEGSTEDPECYMYDHNGNIQKIGKGKIDVLPKTISLQHDGYIRGTLPPKSPQTITEKNDTGSELLSLLTVGVVGDESRIILRFNLPLTQDQLSNQVSAVWLRLFLKEQSSNCQNNVCTSKLYKYLGDVNYSSLDDIQLSSDKLQDLGSLSNLDESGSIGLQVSWLNPGYNVFIIRLWNNGTSGTFYRKYHSMESSDISKRPRVEWQETTDGRKWDGSFTKTFEYDYLNNLVRWTVGSKTEVYSYNSGGQRIKKVDSSGKTSYYIYKGNDVVFDRSEYKRGDLNNNGTIDLSDLSYMVAYLTGALGNYAPEPLALADLNNSGLIDLSDLSALVSYLTGGSYVIRNSTFVADTAYITLGGMRLLSVTNGNVAKIKYYLSDQIGSASIALDKDGREIAKHEYYPFGGTLSASGNVSKYRFTGKEYDDTTGLYYYGARYYNPSLGRFMERDTVDDGPNPYAYVHNNPLIATDPTGHASTNSPADIKLDSLVLDFRYQKADSIAVKKGEFFAKDTISFAQGWAKLYANGQSKPLDSGKIAGGPLRTAPDLLNPGHTMSPTVAGRFKITAAGVPYRTSSWSNSSIPGGSKLRFNNGTFEYQAPKIFTSPSSAIFSEKWNPIDPNVVDTTLVRGLMNYGRNWAFNDFGFYTIQYNNGNGQMVHFTVPDLIGGSGFEIMSHGCVHIETEFLNKTLFYYTGGDPAKLIGLPLNVEYNMPADATSVARLNTGN